MLLLSFRPRGVPHCHHAPHPLLGPSTQTVGRCENTTAHRLEYSEPLKKVTFTLSLPLTFSSAGGKLQESYCYQIFLDQKHSLVLPTVQQLLEHSFHSTGLKLAEVRSPFAVCSHL